MTEDMMIPDEEFEAGGDKAAMSALAKEAMSAMGMETVQRLQKRIIGIQTGSEAPPEWFQRTGFDSGLVRIDLEGDIGEVEIKVCAASAEAMEALDRANQKTEMACEMNAIIESIEELPAEITLRRPFKIRNKTFDAGQHWPNLWKEYLNDAKGAREILGKLLGGKLYNMVKMAMMWLSKVTISDLVDLDPEEGDEHRPPA